MKTRSNHHGARKAADVGSGVGADVCVWKKVSSKGSKAAFCVLGSNDWKESTAARWNSWMEKPGRCRPAMPTWAARVENLSKKSDICDLPGSADSWDAQEAAGDVAREGPCENLSVQQKWSMNKIYVIQWIKKRVVYFLSWQLAGRQSSTCLSKITCSTPRERVNTSASERQRTKPMDNRRADKCPSKYLDTWGRPYRYFCNWTIGGITSSVTPLGRHK